MSTDEYGRLRQEFVEALKVLARDRGVQRDDDQLFALLRGRLQILCRAWGIDLAKSAKEVRADIRARLNEHLAEITPVELRPGAKSQYPKLRGAERKKQFERVVRVVFNVDPKLAYGLSETGTEDRLTWLTTPANRDDKIYYSLQRAAARRDYERARDKIAETLAEREQIAETLLASNTDTGTGAATQTGGQAGEGAGELKAPQRLDVSTAQAGQAASRLAFGRRRFSRRAIVIGVLVVILLSGSIAAFRLIGDTKTPAVKTQSLPTGPITVLAQYHDGEKSYWILPQALGPHDVGRLNGLGDFNVWVPKMHGVLLAQGTYELTITGNDPDGVTITNINVVLIQKKPPLEGSLIAMTGQGVEGNQGIKFNLDANPNNAIDVDPQSQDYGKPYFSRQTVHLAKDEPITFDVNVEALKYDYLFDLTFTMDVQGRLQKDTVSGPNGQPFEISGESRSYDAVFWPAENAISLRYVSSQEYCSLPNSLCIGSPQGSPLS